MKDKRKRASLSILSMEGKMKRDFLSILSMKDKMKRDTLSFLNRDTLSFLSMKERDGSLSFHLSPGMLSRLIPELQCHTF